ncbi:hypothetical protein FRX31_028512 [Thalictrum thalictroides]|uniref:Uncharacterized protein n=1 Tax=Thalictrum thalictroides TaxID=46969 RepID=A0A7J6VAA0_THATH|nr:hypothetical protein FRX31_028512 [Thalictrum thalictroides]
MTTTSLMLLMMITFVKSDLTKDGDECASQLVGLSTCLPYVSGTTVCKAQSNTSECPALLNLPPNSPDAKVFEQFVNSTKGSVPTASTGTPSASNPAPDAKEKSDGSSTKKWLGMKTVVGFVLWYLISIIVGVGV